MLFIRGLWGAAWQQESVFPTASRSSLVERTTAHAGQGILSLQMV